MELKREGYLKAFVVLSTEQAISKFFEIYFNLIVYIQDILRSSLQILISL
ncbi:unnamed protein product [Paramecium octaurelia]|uniref:Uncharacterized protein n=1 Tax=Paramecium octaurelia TaxID=43137 RepID=A0A8S1VXU9_PAROT|nr:unnamed protein product [Paramecium octaurelia]